MASTCDFAEVAIPDSHWSFTAGPSADRVATGTSQPWSLFGAYSAFKMLFFSLFHKLETSHMLLTFSLFLIRDRFYPICDLLVACLLQLQKSSPPRPRQSSCFRFSQLCALVELPEDLSDSEEAQVARIIWTFPTSVCIRFT